MKKQKERNVVESLQFIMDNSRVLDKYDLEKLVKKVTKDLVNEKIESHVGEPTYFGSYLFDLEQSVEYNLARYNEWLKRNWQGDEKQFAYYAKNTSLFYTYYFSISERSFRISQIGYSASNLLYFLRGIILGKFDADYTEANELEEQFKKDNYNSKVLEIGMQTISIKSFNNGRLDIKGLTDEQLDLVVSIINNKKRIFVVPNSLGEWVD